MPNTESDVEGWGDGEVPSEQISLKQRKELLKQAGVPERRGPSQRTH